MLHPRVNAAWLLVRRATSMSDETIIDATGITPETLQDMRQRSLEMHEMGHTPTGNWTLDQVRRGAIFQTRRGQPATAT